MLTLMAFLRQRCLFSQVCRQWNLCPVRRRPAGLPSMTTTCGPHHPQRLPHPSPPRPPLGQYSRPLFLRWQCFRCRKRPVDSNSWPSHWRPSGCTTRRRAVRITLRLSRGLQMPRKGRRLPLLERISRVRSRFVPRSRTCRRFSRKGRWIRGDSSRPADNTTGGLTTLQSVCSNGVSAWTIRLAARPCTLRSRTSEKRAQAVRNLTWRGCRRWRSLGAVHGTCLGPSRHLALRTCSASSKFSACALELWPTSCKHASAASASSQT
mmetsp:Transcript_56818/g.151711  ORF Transcript_56818/g.151711 Transcript_56818/m.151711 type:complete len:265 (+) Transcript_56818:2437-3231(+)